MTDHPRDDTNDTDLHGSPTSLYKFRGLGPSAMEFASRILTHNEIYFPSAAELNDPWESRPAVVTYPNLGATFISRDGTMHEAFGRRVRDARSFQPRLDRQPPISEKLRREFDATTYKPGTFSFQDRPTLRLCSFAGDFAHPLLWSHYADAHRGMCIEFDATMSPFSDARRITYAKEYPVFSDIWSEMRESEVSREQRWWRIEEKGLIHKSDVWSYENEYRLLAGCPGVRDPSILDANSILHFPPQAVTRVILGCRVSDADRTRVSEWIRARSSPTKLTQAVLHPGRFELTFEERNLD